MSEPSPIELEFSRKYDFDHAQQYLQKHQDGLARRLSHWRDLQLARRALQLADQPNLVLDLPCGAGRFWPMLCEQPNRVILAADNSADRLATARAAQPPEVVARVSSGGWDTARPWLVTEGQGRARYLLRSRPGSGAQARRGAGTPDPQRDRPVTAGA